MENNLLVLATVFLPFVGAAVALFVNRDMPKRYTSLMFSFGAWLASLLLLIQVLDDSTQLYRLGDWEPPYGIVLVADPLSALFGFMSSSVMLMGILYAVQCNDKCVKYPAFMSLFLGMETGLLGVMYTGDIFTMFVFIELTVISSVSLVAISDDKLGLEAGVKYILISSLGTIFLLLGIASIYVTFGTVNFADLARQLQAAEGEEPLLTRAAAIMMMCAFLLKSGTFPFHWWQPDFHTTAPTPVHAMLSSVVVKIGVYGLLRMTNLLFIEQRELLQNWMIILGIISIFFGSLSAMRTYNGKRILAYSTFAQVGFVLLGIGIGTPLALVAAIVYAFNHALIKSSLLMLMGVVASRNVEHTATLTKMAGTGTKMHWSISLLFILGGMALAGMPPMNGFISKFLLVQSGLEAEEWIPIGLAVGGGLLTLIYMMKTWQYIFQQKPTEVSATVDVSHGDGYLAPAILISASLLLGVFATPLYDAAVDIVDAMADPEGSYINVVAPDDWNNTVTQSEDSSIFGG